MPPCPPHTAPRAPGMACSSQPALAAACPGPGSPRRGRRHLGEPSCSVGTNGGLLSPTRVGRPHPGSGTGGLQGLRARPRFHTLSSAQAGEANRPHQRSSPLSELIPGHRGRFADSARLPLKEAATKVSAGLENAASQPAPSSEGRAQLPRGLPGTGEGPAAARP